MCNLCEILLALATQMTLDAGLLEAGGYVDISMCSLKETAAGHDEGIGHPCKKKYRGKVLR